MIGYDMIGFDMIRFAMLCYDISDHMQKCTCQALKHVCTCPRTCTHTGIAPVAKEDKSICA